MPTYGAFAHNKIQLGRETVPGTGVAATTIWRGSFGNIQDARERVIVEEQVGILVNAERSYDSSYLARLEMPSTPLTFEQVLHILEAGVKTVAPTGAGPYVYTYAFPTNNTVNTIKTYTIEAFNAVADADYREMAYSMVEEFTFEAAAGEAWQMSANWIGRQPVASTATSLSTLLAVEEALLMKTSLFIDASGGTMGTTQKTGVLMGASINCKTGVVPVMVGDGQLYFASHKFTKPEITFSLTLELEETTGVSVVNAERTAYESNSVRLIKLSTAGSSGRLFDIAFAGKYDSFGNYENSEGNTTVTLEGHAVYSSGDSKFCEFVVTNSTAVVP